MKTHLKDKYQHRKWNDPNAEVRYQQQLKAAMGKRQAMVEATADSIVEAINREQRIEALSETALLFELARITNTRLYDKSIDDRLSGYAKQKQGDRQQVMRDALRKVIEDDSVLYAKNGDQIIISALPEPKPLPKVFEGDQCVLEPRLEAQLRQWGEPVQQFR